MSVYMHVCICLCVYACVSTYMNACMCVNACVFVWVDALRPWSTAEVMSGRSVILSTLFLGKPASGR